MVCGETGVFAGLQQGSAYIDTSTNAPAVIRKIARIGRPRRFDVLDAPISGGVLGAREATLTVFVGGEKETFDRYQSLLQCFGKTVAYMGPAGSGNVTKLVNNVIMFTNLVGACEGLAIGAKAGLDLQALLDVINQSLGQSAIMERCMTLLLRNEQMHSATDLAVKDMRLGLELGQDLEVPLELSPLVADIITRFRDGGRGQEDINVIIRHFLERSGVAM